MGCLSAKRCWTMNGADLPGARFRGAVVNDWVNATDVVGKDAFPVGSAIDERTGSLDVT